MNSLSGKASLLATGGANEAWFCSIQRMRWTGSSSAMTGPSPGSGYDRPWAPEGPPELAEPAIRHGLAADAVGVRPAAIREGARAEQPVDQGQVDGKVGVHRLGRVGVVPVVEARRHHQPLDRLEAEADVGVDEHRGERGEYEI